MRAKTVDATKSLSVKREGSVITFFPQFAGACDESATADKKIWKINDVTVISPTHLTVDVQPLADNEVSKIEEELKIMYQTGWKWEKASERISMIASVSSGELFEIRHPQNGDKLSRKSNRCTIKLSSFLRLQGVPVHLREVIWIISSLTTGLVVWVPPFTSFENHDKPSESGLDKEHDRRFLLITITNTPPNRRKKY